MFVYSLEPVAVDAPRTSYPTAHTVDIMWSAPSQPNGLIVEYKIYENGTYRESVSAGELWDMCMSIPHPILNMSTTGLFVSVQQWTSDHLLVSFTLST